MCKTTVVIQKLLLQALMSLTLASITNVGAVIEVTLPFSTLVMHELLTITPNVYQSPGKKKKQRHPNVAVSSVCQYDDGNRDACV